MNSGIPYSIFQKRKYRRPYIASTSYVLLLSCLPIPMISMLKFATQVAHKFTLVDRSIAKIDLIVVGLLLAKLFPVLTSLHRGWYVVLIILAEIYFIRRIKQMKIGKMDK